MRPDAKLSPQTFEDLITRAVEIQAREGEGIDLARARQIAAELGVNSASWEAALREHADANQAPSSGLDLSRVAAVAAGGVFIGALLVAIGGSGLKAILVGGSVIAAGLALGGYEVLRSRLRNGEAHIAAWWAGVPTGIALWHGDLPIDAGTYAFLSWAGSTAALALFAAVRRHAPGLSEPSHLTNTPTGQAD